MPRVVQMRVSDIIRDPSVNIRPLREDHVNEMVANPRLYAIGVLVVSRRATGDVVVLGGQHRREMLLRLGLGKCLIDVQEFRGLTRAQETALFIWYDEQRAISYADKFIAAQDAAQADPKFEIQRACGEIIIASGWSLDREDGFGAMYAKQQCERIYRASGGAHAASIDGPSALGATLRSLRGAWGLVRDTGHRNLVSAVGRVYLRYGSAIDEKRMVKALARFDGPRDLLTKGEQLKDVRSAYSSTSTIPELVVDAYNDVSSRSRLVPWRTTLESAR